MRNLFRDQYRKRQREVEDADGYYLETLKSEPEQTARLEFSEFRAALAKLSSEQSDKTSGQNSALGNVIGRLKNHISA